jgi:hypothetical protein
MRCEIYARKSNDDPKAEKDKSTNVQIEKARAGK